MARGGINKALVQKAQKAILARGENPSIEAVRVELGNTGSKTTIHRYLKELDDAAAGLVERFWSRLEPAEVDELTRLLRKAMQPNE